jgi:hypothetical protein
MSPSLRRIQLEAYIIQLNELNRDELAKLWTKAHGHKPFKGASRKLLIRSAAYMLQEKLFGGLGRSTRKQLLQIATQGTSTANGHANTQLQPGMRLIREWHGKQCVVDITEDGFVWNGKTYSSLSAIARAITGAHWSGPRFFRL